MSLFIDTLLKKKTKRPPVWFMRQAGRVLPSYLEIKKEYSFSDMMQSPEMAAKITKLPIDDLGVDAAILFSDILVIPQALGMTVDFTEKGPVFNSPINIENVTNNIQLKADITKLEHIFNAIKIFKNKSPNVPLIGFCGAPLTVLCYMIDGKSLNHLFPKTVNMIFQNRKYIEKILDNITELSIEYAMKQIDAGIDAFQLFDTHAGLIPNQLYIDMFLPYIKRISNAIRSRGVPVIFFPKGIGNAISKITSDFTDFVSIDWLTSMYTADKLVDKELGFQGNFDPRILFAEKNIIEENLKHYLEFFNNDRSWIFNLGHGVMPNTKFDNLKFVVDWIKNIDWK